MELIILKFLWKNSMKYFPYQKPPQPCKLESLEQILSGSHHSPYSMIETLLSMGKNYTTTSHLFDKNSK